MVLCWYFVIFCLGELELLVRVNRKGSIVYIYVFSLRKGINKELMVRDKIIEVL